MERLKIEFDKCNPIILLSVAGVIALGMYLIRSGQDGFLLKSVLIILAGTAGLAADVPEWMKGWKKQ